MSGLSEPTCECGHEVRWHGDLGCGYLGWHYETPKCGCRLTDAAAVQQITEAAVRAALEAAAVQIEAASPGTYHGGNSIPHSFASDCAKCGGEQAADIVRAAIPQSSQPPAVEPTGPPRE